MIIPEKLVQEVNSFVWDIPLIFRRDKSRPGLFGISVHTRRWMGRIKLRDNERHTCRVCRRTAHPTRCHTSRDTGTIHLSQAPSWSSLAGRSYHARERMAPCGISSKDIKTRVPVDINVTYHWRKHASKTPHIKAVIVFLKIYKQFRSLKVPGRNADVVFRLWMIEFS